MRRLLSYMLLLSCFLLFPINISAQETCAEKPLGIMSCDIQNLVLAYEQIKRCVELDGRATVYVQGLGGIIDHAHFFFDLMRTSGLSKKTTFISAGQIISSTNIIWLASEHRVVLPSVMFLLHKATVRFPGEDIGVITDYQKQTWDTTQRLVQMATGNESTAKMWHDIIAGHRVGGTLDAEKALEIGWATEIRAYK